MATEDDDDILIPRGLHSTANKNHGEAIKTPIGFSIDPAMLERRSKRREALGPSASDSSAEAPWKYLDRSMARVPAFDDTMWTLADVARWVLERTPEAVNGLSTDEARLPEAFNEIHMALAKGQIEAWSATIHEPVPRALPAATWSVFDFAFEVRDGLLYAHTFRASGSVDERPLKDIRFNSVEIRRHWPGAEPAPLPPTTIAAQKECKRWLSREMSATPDRPRPKSQLWAEATTRFPRLSRRSFDLAWKEAVNETGALKWSIAGPRTG
jgi:hypothetical protein